MLEIQEFLLTFRMGSSKFKNNRLHLSSLIKTSNNVSCSNLQIGLKNRPWNVGTSRLLVRGVEHSE